MTLTIRKAALANRIKELAAGANCSPATWVSELVEDWIREHRSGKLQLDPSRHAAQHEDTTGIYLTS